MASGDVVGFIGEISPPASTYPAETIVAGASSPNEAILVYAFDDSTVEYLDFIGRLEGYASGGLTVKLGYSSAANTGNVLWGAAIRAIPDDAEDMDTTVHSYDYNNASADTAPSVIGELSYLTITFSDDADMDSLADGEGFILRIRRHASDAADTHTGDAYLWPQTVIILET